MDPIGQRHRAPGRTWGGHYDAARVSARKAATWAGLNRWCTDLWGRALGAKRALGLPAVRRLASRAVGLRDHVERAPAAPTPVAWLAATALLVRRQAFVQVGGFDEGYFLYGEDFDLARRLGAAGWALVALPDDWARHESGGSSGGWWLREVAWWEGNMRYAARWWSARAWWSAVGAAGSRWLWLAARSPKGTVVAWRRMVQGPLHRRREVRGR